MKNNRAFNILPNDVWKWQYVENKIHEIADLFNFKEIRTSILQPREIINTSCVDPKDIHYNDILLRVEGDENLSLIADTTMTILQTEIANKAESEVQKLYYSGPIFRKRDKSNNAYELHQAGFEILGHKSPVRDIELMEVGIRICRNLGIGNPIIHLSSFGCEECRSEYKKEIRKFVKQSSEERCQKCNEISLFNPVYGLTCTRENCTQLSDNAPTMYDFLCSSCRKDLDNIQRVLSNLTVDFELNPYLDRPFGYYHRTVFNIAVNINDELHILGGGGRYAGLSDQSKGTQIPGVGITLNMEKVIALLDKLNSYNIPDGKFKTMLCTQNEDLDTTLMQIVLELHDHGFSTLIEPEYKHIDELKTIAEIKECALIISIDNHLIRNGKVLLANLNKDHIKEIDLCDIIDEVELANKSIDVL